jgi:hypothetical protein
MCKKIMCDIHHHYFLFAKSINLFLNIIISIAIAIAIANTPNKQPLKFYYLNVSVGSASFFV